MPNTRPASNVSCRAPKCGLSLQDPWAPLRSQFDIGKTLGAGSFASVSAAVHRDTGEACALKRIASRPRRQTAMAPPDEFAIGLTLSASGHANILKTLDLFDSPLGQRWGLCVLQMELACGGDLFTMLDPSGAGVDECLSRRLVAGITSGVRHIHHLGFVHADLKPENIVVHGQVAKICDFGLARRDGDACSFPAVGTAAYMAPELLATPGVMQFSYTAAQPADIWAVGIVLHAVLFRDLPWEQAKSSDPDYGRFLTGGGVSDQAYPFDGIAGPMREMLDGLLAADPAARPDAEEVFQFFQCKRAWFADCVDSLELADFAEDNASLLAAAAAAADEEDAAEATEFAALEAEVAALEAEVARLELESTEEDHIEVAAAAKPQTITAAQQLSCTAQRRKRQWGMCMLFDPLSRAMATVF